MAGYSGTPLQKKLGIKPGMRVVFINQPPNYQSTLGKLPPDLQILTRPGKDMDLLHLFCGSLNDLQKKLPIAKKSLSKNGLLWVSWIKKSAKIETDVGEADVRRLGLDLGLVDVKICAVDETWSGLKFVYRLKDR